jgi:hypothetical protein
MNIIEKAWIPIKIDIIKIWNRPHTLKWTERAWYAKWKILKQNQIREWIHHIIEINQRILDHEKDNQFHG